MKISTPLAPMVKWRSAKVEDDFADRGYSWYKYQTIFCPKCGYTEQACTVTAINSPEVVEIGDNALRRRRAEPDKTATCHNCGTSYNSDEYINVFGAYHSKVMYRKIFVDDMKVKFTYGKMIYTFFNGRIQRHMLTTRMVFHVDKGRTYVVEPWVNGRKPTEKMRQWFHIEHMKQRARNVSYGEGLLDVFKNGVPRENLNELAATLFNKIQENLGFDIRAQFTDEHGCLRDDLYMHHLCLINRFPTMNIDAIKGFAKFREEMEGYKLPRKFTKIKNTEDFFQCFFKSFKISEKAYQRLIRKNLCAKNRLAEYSEHFHSFDIIKKLVESRYDYYNLNYHSPQAKARTSEFTRVAITALAGIRTQEELEKCTERQWLTGETIFARKLIDVDKRINDPRHFFTEAADMYFNIQEQMPTFEMDWSGDIKDIHDYLDLTQRKLTTPLRTLRYLDEDLLREECYGPYEFRFARDTHELIYIGNKMNICVGGYGNRAYKRELNIIIMYHEDQPLVCIELSGDCTQVCQAKLFGNKYPDGEVREIILSWIRKHKMVINTYDLGSELCNTRSYEDRYGKLHPDTMLELGIEFEQQQEAALAVQVEEMDIYNEPERIEAVDVARAEMTDEQARAMMEELLQDDIYDPHADLPF